MSYPYFFVNSGSIEGNKIKIEGEDLNHLINVLRSKTGDMVYISDNADYKYKTEIIDIKKSDVILLIKDKRKIAKKIPPALL